jgi:hypothetical protein
MKSVHKRKTATNGDDDKNCVPDYESDGRAMGEQ